MTVCCAVTAVFGRRHVVLMLAFVSCYDSFRVASSSLNMFANIASSASALVIAPVNHHYNSKRSVANHGVNSC